MAILHGIDCSNEVTELLFLGTVMQLYSFFDEVGKYTQNVTTKRLDLRIENGVVLVI